jgi:TatD DNase family protein
MAHRDLLNILNEFETLRPTRAVAHGFVGTLEELKEYLNLGYFIGFNGIIFKNIEGVDFKKNIEYTPLERMVLETDCPYLTPLPELGRNEPSYLPYIARKIAEIKNLSFEKIAEVTTRNANYLFGIEKLA